eukprot:GFUD01061397.1.p1 GENE.GFUD01061397.1~~GFUD01061397.1.p1  ORF type:complete len:143 (+),score=20.88 GFUD01061397.1:78-506(+)
MRVQREENYMERMNAKVFTNFVEDVEFSRMKRDVTMSSDCTENIGTMEEESVKCLKDSLEQWFDDVFEDREAGVFRDTSGETKPDYFARKPCNYLTTSIQVPATQIPGTRYQIPDAQCQMPGARCPIPNTRYPTLSYSVIVN